MEEAKTMAASMAQTWMSMRDPAWTIVERSCDIDGILKVNSDAYEGYQTRGSQIGKQPFQSSCLLKPGALGRLFSISFLCYFYGQ